MNVSEILSLQLHTIKVNKGKFTLQIGPSDGSHALILARIALMQRL